MHRTAKCYLRRNGPMKKASLKQIAMIRMLIETTGLFVKKQILAPVTQTQIGNGNKRKYYIENEHRTKLEIFSDSHANKLYASTHNGF